LASKQIKAQGTGGKIKNLANGLENPFHQICPPILNKVYFALFYPSRGHGDKIFLPLEKKNGRRVNRQ
jgi:hypothetical protein